MRKLSRRHIENLKKTKNITALNLEQAISVLQETSTAKFTTNQNKYRQKRQGKRLRRATGCLLTVGTFRLKKNLRNP